MMNRYTIRLETGEARCSQLDGNAVVERLAAYEDSDLMPEQVEAAKNIIQLAFADDTTAVERLRALYFADKDGRALILPRKVGETVYYLNGKYIIEVEVIGYKTDEKGAWLFIRETYNPETNRAYHCDLETERIGETVFFARAEAERALEERKYV